MPKQPRQQGRVKNFTLASNFLAPVVVVVLLVAVIFDYGY